MSDPDGSHRPTILAWKNKFRYAFAGIAWAVRTQSSFRIHLPIATAVLIVAGLLCVEPWRWAVLVLVIGMVIAAELINTAVEQLVAVVHPQNDPQIGNALDAAAGAVLVLSLAAITIGLIVLGPPLWAWCFPL